MCWPFQIGAFGCSTLCLFCFFSVLKLPFGLFVPFGLVATLLEKMSAPGSSPLLCLGQFIDVSFSLPCDIVGKI